MSEIIYKNTIETIDRAKLKTTLCQDAFTYGRSPVLMGSAGGNSQNSLACKKKKAGKKWCELITEDELVFSRNFLSTSSHSFLAVLCLAKGSTLKRTSGAAENRMACVVVLLVKRRTR